MFRLLAALITVAVFGASSSFADARAVHPLFIPFGDSGRRLIGIAGCDECIAICQQVHYRTLCSRLAMLPAVTTPKQLLDGALRVSAAKAAMAAMRLDGVMRSGGRAKGKAMASSLQSCRDSYASLVDSLKTSRTTLRNGGSHDDLMSSLSAAGTFSTDCKDIFAERPELKSPIKGLQRHITRLVSNCIELAAIIKQIK